MLKSHIWIVKYNIFFLILQEKHVHLRIKADLEKIISLVDKLIFFGGFMHSKYEVQSESTWCIKY